MAGNTLSPSEDGEKSRKQRLSELIEFLDTFTESFLQNETGEPLTAEEIRLLSALADAGILAERLSGETPKESISTLNLGSEIVERITGSLLKFPLSATGGGVIETGSLDKFPEHNYGDNCPKCFGGVCDMAPFVRKRLAPITDIIESNIINKKKAPRNENTSYPTKCESCGGVIDLVHIHICPTPY